MVLIFFIIQKNILIFTFLFVFGLIIFRNINISRNDEGQAYQYYYGDAFSEKVSMSSAQYFKDSGFTQTAFLPVYNYAKAKQNVSSEPFVYTHYPPLGELIASFKTLIFNSYNFKILSIIPVLFSGFFFIVIYKKLKEFTQQNKAALWGTLFITTTPFFIGYGNNIHMHVYMEILKWLYVFGLWKYWKKEDGKTKKIFLLFLFSFLCCCFSFEYFIYFGIITFGFHKILKGKWISWELLFLLLAPPLCFALHLVQNYFYFGNWKDVIDDFKQILLKRTVGSGNITNELGRILTASDYFSLLPKIWLHRLGMMYGLPVITLIGFIFLSLKYFKNNSFKKEYWGIIILIIASLHWAFIMPQHSIIHIFTLRHWSILLSISVGVGMPYFFENLKVNVQIKNKKALLFSSVFVIYTFVFWLSHTVFFQYLKFGFLYPIMGKEGVEWFSENIFW